ncbi:MAG: flagellar basal-body rod protein FlgF [Burkholderiales bacterium]
MDRMIYVAMAGAQQLFSQQAVVAHNLANAGTPGYKADTTAFRVAPVVGPGLSTRAYAVTSTPGANHAAGSIQKTGRELDVAIQGDGFFAVQTPDGNEAYTRNGSFQVSPDGMLTTSSGLTVVGDGGPISVPPDSNLTIAKDGTVSLTTYGQSAANVTTLGRLKLVNPDKANLVKGQDGLFRLSGGGDAEADENVTLVSGSLEESNVSAVSTMIDMIQLARQFDLSMRLLQDADADAQRANQLLSINP